MLRGSSPCPHPRDEPCLHPRSPPKSQDQLIPGDLASMIAWEVSSYKNPASCTFTEDERSLLPDETLPSQLSIAPPEGGASRARSEAFINHTCWEQSQPCATPAVRLAPSCWRGMRHCRSSDSPGMETQVIIAATAPWIKLPPLAHFEASLSLISLL